MPQAVLGLGGNMGSRRALLACARDLLAAQPGLSILAVSPLYHTPPLGPPQPDYLNAALKVDWPGSARSLLRVTQYVEQLLERQRSVRWGPRTLDIDLLFWSAGDVDEPGLTIPHPGLGTRLFARVPLLDVAPELAPRFGAGLAHDARNFAPSEPFAARAVRSGQRARTAASDDPGELLAALPSALASFAAPVSGGLGVLPFSVPMPAEKLALEQLDAPILALLARVRAAFTTGFHVQSAAITEVGAGRFRGVFVGQHDAGCKPLPPLVVTLARGPHAARLEVAPT